MSFLSNLANVARQRAGQLYHTIGNDIQHVVHQPQPMPRPQPRPTGLPQQVQPGFGVLAPGVHAGPQITRQQLQQQMHPSLIHRIGTAVDQVGKQTGLGLERTGVGLLQSGSGLYDLAGQRVFHNAPSGATNRFDKVLDSAGKSLDTRSHNIGGPSRAAYNISQVAGNLGSFMIPGTVVKGIAQIPRVANVIDHGAPVINVANKVVKPLDTGVTKVAANIATHGPAGRIAAAGIKGGLSGTNLLNTAAGTALTTGQMASHGQKVTGKDVATNAALNLAMGAGLSASPQAAREAIAGAKGADKAIRTAHIKANTNASIDAGIRDIRKQQAALKQRIQKAPLNATRGTESLQQHINVLDGQIARLNENRPQMSTVEKVLAVQPGGSTRAVKPITDVPQAKLRVQLPDAAAPVQPPKAAEKGGVSSAKSTPIKVKGSLSDTEYKARFGKDKPPTSVKVQPFDSPKFDFTKWKDSNALGLGRETMERNIDRLAGKDAPVVKKLLVDSSRENETKRVEFANGLRKDTKQAVINDLGIKPGSKESALTQQYGEGLKTKQDIINEVGNDKAAKIFQASDYFRKQYDTLIDQWNKQRSKYGYDPIPKRKDYFRHFQAINQNASILGTIKNARDLPTEISGITDIFSPNKPFSDAALQRKGNKTTYDAVGGFDNYIDSVSRQIFHTDTVQKGRALEAAIRKQAAANPTLELPNLVANIHEWTNLVSGKKSRIDRAAEELVGRKVYAAANAIRSKVGANMIGANIGSALTNFVPFTQAAATTTKTALTKGMADTVSAAFGKDFHAVDGVTSSFLTRRFPDGPLPTNWVQKASEKASLPFHIVDSFTSRSIVAGKYFEGRAKGMKPEAAMKAADDYAARVITDRSVGQMPNLLESKTPGFLTQFQAEVNNQLSFLGRDIPKFANGSKAKIASSLLQFAVYSYLANEGYQHLVGRRVQLDPVDFAKTALDPKKNMRQKLNAGKEDILGGLPFTSVFTGGRLPVNAMLPDVASIGKGIGDFKSDKNKAGREIYKGVSGPLAYGLPPFGGGQLKKTGEYIQNMSKGYSETPAGTKRFDVAKDPVNTAKGLLFGQYATTPGQGYVNSINGGKKNATNQTASTGSSTSLKAQAKTAQQPTKGIYTVKGKDGSTKYATLQGANLRTYKDLNSAKEAQAKNMFKYSKQQVTTINGQLYHKSASGTVEKGAPSIPKANLTKTTYDQKSNTWTQTNQLTGKTVKVDRNGTQTVLNKGIGNISNARSDYVSNIRSAASKYGVDGNAAMAVAAMEGLGGGVGDNGTSFGPFQMHIGGAMPRGKDQAWAESPAGIDYAMKQIASVAKGKSGAAAIQAIVNGFEKPLDPNGEYYGALSIYGGKTASLTSGQANSTKVSGTKSKTTLGLGKNGGFKAYKSNLSSAIKAAKAANEKPKNYQVAKVSLSSRMKGSNSGMTAYKTPKLTLNKRA